jgi:hypothetical protein
MTLRDDPETFREYMREYQRIWIAARRAAFFAGKVCAKCGNSENLELDHIDPAVKVSAAIWSWSDERRAIELAKCQVLCHDCHLKKTKGEALKGERVGTSKLTEDDVRAIRKSNLTPYRLIAEQYGIDRSMVGKIKRNEFWKHVQ